MSAISATGSALGPQDDRPLNEQEFQLLQRLLSDPFSFPLAFKTWLVSYLSASDLSLPISGILGLQSLLGITGAGSGSLGIFPAGIILPYGGTTAPLGSKMCDGASYFKTAEPRLFAAIGVGFGSDSADTFKVPDGRGRGLVGVGTHGDVNALNKTEGLGVNARTPRHRSSVNDPGHAHTVFFHLPFSGGVNEPQSQQSSNATDFRATSSNGTGITIGPQTGSEPVDTGAYLTCNYIIIS